ncbi:MAG: MFS transporter [Chloroflexi bacterium]|nr:MFS transporter [Chloroflexota bacterium]
MTDPATTAIDSDRPTQLLPLSQLLRLSVYWLGLIAVVNGIGVILQERIKDLVPDSTVQYTTLGIIQAAGVLIAVLVQPIAGSISDYTISRFGRRKPYILVGTLLDVLFLIGIATSNTVLAVGAFVVLLQFSANFAQGPFQGYVPDLIPPAQVGLASGLVGLFTVLGVVVGTALASIGLAIGDFTIPTIALGVIELVTMLSLFFRLEEGRAAKDRAGKSWAKVAVEAWGRDVLQERSFMFLVASRFFILGGGFFLVGLLVPYLERAQGITNPDERAVLILVATGIVALCTAISTIPAARIADRYGRKRVIYVASLIAAVGMTICALAPSIPVFIGGAILMGIGTGSFLAVDWALMTEIIPKASSGRFMGISNVATATNGVISAFIGGVLVDALVRAGSPTLGPRVAFLLAPIWFLIGALLLRPVVEPERPASRLDTATG